MKRQMNNFFVEQRTKDSMFNATNLLKQWNEFVEYNDDTQNSVYVKSKVRSDRGGGTWMHSILFVKFAMWLNPRFEVQVIKFVYDQMLKYRNDACDAYKELGSAISKIVSKKFMPAAMCKIAKAIN